MTDLVKLVRTYGVLAGALDTERVLAGTIDRDWIAREVEQYVPLASLPKAFFDTQRGHDMLAAELFPDEDIDPLAIQPAALDIDTLGAERLINTNRLPKLEATLHRAVLEANMLLGVRLYGDHGKGQPKISYDFIIATMLQHVRGHYYGFSDISPDDVEIVDDSFIRSWFGSRVAEFVRSLADHHALFRAAVDAGEAPPEPSSARMATAIAALEASELRLIARAAGDRVISFLDEDQRQHLRACGIDVDDPFPEYSALEAAYRRTEAAFALPGVDHYALREPLRNTLMQAVRDALDEPDKRDRLSGRRGKAVHEVHINLPVMEYFVAAEAPNSIETVHLASLEMMRSLEKGRRKSVSTMVAHAFNIASLAERVLGRALEPLIVTLAMLHDVVEDGSLRVTGYGHSLRRIQFRFGGPIAAMVSELTDSTVTSAAGRKAQLTLRQPHLILPQAQYDVGRFTSMTVKATEDEVPYTLAGIVIKLLDTVVSMKEGLRDPDLMQGYWRHSGARIHWAERDRGEIVKPLIERLVIEIRRSKDDPKYRRRPHHVNAVRLRAGRAMLEMVLLYQDLYATQNLAILAAEFCLDAGQRDTLIQHFFDRNLDEAMFRERVIDRLLDDAHVLAGIASGRVPSLDHVTLYPKDATDCHERDATPLLEYRQSAIRRQLIRQELDMDTPDRLSNAIARRERLLQTWDERHGWALFPKPCLALAQSMTTVGMVGN
ncbi:MAG: hypothetical protein CSB44_00725 [Gammaproteobacteria bacterium]|nr:MAG: hypothetical protein CSB44_00725 [Gammaproteobacteria bacterium]